MSNKKLESKIIKEFFNEAFAKNGCSMAYKLTSEQFSMPEKEVVHYLSQSLIDDEEEKQAQSIETLKSDVLKGSFINAVECSVCNQLHKSDAKSYLVIWGNIDVGSHYSLVGANIDNQLKVINTKIVCRSAQCFDKILNHSAKQPIKSKKSSHSSKYCSSLEEAEDDEY